MSLTNRVGLLAGLATLTLAGVGFAGSDESNTAALEKQIDLLRQELDQVKAQQGDAWLTEQRAAEIRSLVQDVLADADTRASLQASGMTAGWDKGFFLASPDGNFRLRIKGQIQVRYMLNDRDNPTVGTGTTSGFELPRVKLKFLGNIFDKSWTYKVQGNFSQNNFGAVDGDIEVPDPLDPTMSIMVPFSAGVTGSSGRFVLEDAYIQKDFDNGFYIRGGQFKVPYTREELVSSTTQLLIERSTVNRVFGSGRSQGIEGGWQGDWLRFMVTYNDGDHGANTSFDDPNFNLVDWSFAGRAEFKLAGDWAQFDDMNSWNGDPFGVLIGVAGKGYRRDDGTKVYGATADASIDFGGANLFGYFVWQRTEPDGGEESDAIAFVVQGGIFVIPDKLEPYGRFEWADSDIDGDSDLANLFAGVNWYFSRQAKLSTDFGYAFNEITATWTNPQAGWLLDGPDDDGQWVWRTQFQLLF